MTNPLSPSPASQPPSSQKQTSSEALEHCAISLAGPSGVFWGSTMSDIIPTPGTILVCQRWCQMDSSVQMISQVNNILFCEATPPFWQQKQILGHWQHARGAWEASSLGRGMGPGPHWGSWGWMVLWDQVREHGYTGERSQGHDYSRHQGYEGRR